MASDTDNEAAIRHKSLQDFAPIKPVNTTARELTEEVVIKNSPAEGFVHVLLRQWREDTTSSPQRETWGIVQEPLEAALVYADLRGGRISDGSAPAITEDQLARNPTCGAEEGRLSITTFGALAGALFGALRDQVQFPENVSIVMNFGYGLVTFDMALATTSLVRLIRHLAAGGNNTLAACTVSNTRMGVLGRGWPSRVTQEIDSEEISVDRYEWRAAQAGAGDQQGEDGAPEGALGLFKRSCQQDEHGKRAVLLMSLYQGLIPDAYNNTFIRVQRIANPDIIYKVKYELDERIVGTNVAIDKGIVCIGPIKNVGRILVPRHVPGFEFDSRSGQAVVNLLARRSRPEIEYAGGLRGADGHPPQVCCDMTLAEYQGAPPAPTTSPAHTVDLPRLLLIYIHTWTGSDLPLVDMPATLPADEYMVETQLRHLMAKGLVEVQSPPPNPFVAVGRRRLHSTLKLTQTGLRTTVLLLTGRTQNIHVAHFLAQTLRDNPQEAGIDDKAILHIASVLETRDGLTQLAGIVDTAGANQGSIELFQNTAELENGPSANIQRGPLWLCLSLWCEMRVNQNYRGAQDTYRSNQVPFLLDLLSGAGQPKALVIHRLRSFEWDRTLESLREVLNKGREGEFLFEDKLSNSDLLSVEMALVRAYLDKLAYVPLSHNITSETPFAFDLASNRPIQSPAGQQKHQLNEEYCRRLERLPGGRPPPGIFCFYTYLTLEEDENGQPRWSAQDMTHVSWEAVWRVLKENKGCRESQDLLHKIQTDQIYTQ